MKEVWNPLNSELSALRVKRIGTWLYLDSHQVEDQACWSHSD